MNEENQPKPGEPAVSQPVFQMSAQQNEALIPPKSKKGLIFAAIAVLVVSLIGLGVAYALLVYIPNKPENVFKKAVANFADGGNYTMTGRLDHGDGNAPDFEYIIKTDGDDVLVSIDSSTFVMGPNVEVMNVQGRQYVKFSEWMDDTELAKHYTNYLEEGIQENLAEFAGATGIYNNQNKWIQIDDFVFNNPAVVSESADPDTIEEFGVSIESIGSVEEKDGKKLQNYKIELTKDGFVKLLDQVSGSPVARSIFDEYVEVNGFPDSLSLDLQIDKSSKTIYHLSYSGRPFKDATLSLDLSVGENSFTPPEDSQLASEVLDYGVVKTFIFSPDFQNAESAADRERIADIKGIKMAMEIYKRKHGSYPMRSLPVTQEGQMLSEMRGADRAIFVDPNGKFLSWHGSQYTYIGETAEGSETCGGSFYDINTQQDFKAPDCDKFWVVSMLGNGQEYKLTSY